jgi:hypothetical protein
MNGGFSRRSKAKAHPPDIGLEDIPMLRQKRLARKSAARSTARAAHHDMALASTIVFFGVFPLVIGAGLVLVQTILAFTH